MLSSVASAVAALKEQWRLLRYDKDELAEWVRKQLEANPVLEQGAGVPDRVRQGS